MKRKLIATLLVLGLMLTFVPMTTLSASADEVVNTWDADAAEPIVTTMEDLFSFVQAIVDGNDFSGKTIKIAADIDVTHQTWPMSGQQGVFSGMIDGQGHTLKGIRLNAGGTYQGIFGGYLVPVEGSVVGVKNLTIQSSSVLGSELAGGLFGQINNKNGDVAGAVLFEDLDLDINVTVTTAFFAGGIAGVSRADEMTISNCVIRGYVTGTSAVGGMIGQQMDKALTVTNCVVSSEVTGSGQMIGGFFGQVRERVGGHGSNTVMDGCVFSGTINTSFKAKATRDGVEVYESYNAQVGGFVGLVGAMNDSGQPRPGVVTISNSAFYGAIAVTAADTTAATKFGGFVGENYANSNSVITVSNVIVGGYMSAPEDCTVNNNGLILGWLNAGGTFTLTNAVGQVKAIDSNHKVLTGTNGTGTTGWSTSDRTSTVTAAYAYNMFSAPVTSLTFSNKDGNASFSLAETFKLVGGLKPLPKGIDPLDIYGGEMTISTAEEMLAFVAAIAAGNNFAGTTVKLAADIDVTGQAWPMQGQTDAKFFGMIDGQGHTLKGVKIEATDSATDPITHSGIFGSYLVPAGIIAVGVKNLTVVESSVSGTTQTGGLFGQINTDASFPGAVLFENLDLDIAVTGTGAYTGAIAGASRADEMTISNCVIRGSVNGPVYVGGMIGWQMDKALTVKNSVVTAEITAGSASQKNVFAGGFFAQIRERAGGEGAVTVIDGCVFNGTIKMIKPFAKDNFDGAMVGGFVGQVGDMFNGSPRPGKLTITNSAYYGSIEATVAETATKIGGFVGENCANSTGTEINVSNVIARGYMSAPIDCNVNHNGIVLGWLNAGGTFTLTNAVGFVKEIDDEHQTLAKVNGVGLGIGSSPCEDYNPETPVPTDRTCTMNPTTIYAGPNMFVEPVISLTFSNQAGDASFSLEETFKLVDNSLPLPKEIDPANITIVMEEPKLPEEDEEEGGDDAGDTNTTQPADTTAPAADNAAPDASEEPAKKGCGSVVTSAAGILFASIMAGAVCLGKRKED